MVQAKITAEQAQALQQAAGRPVRLVDDAGADVHVSIVRTELLESLIEGDFEIADTYLAQQTALAGVWDDPRLDEYTDQDGAPID